MMRRPAYTLLELMVALGSASVLMAGLSSSLYIASQSLNLDRGATASRGRASVALGRLLADARTATRFRSVGSTAIEFDVADRTGDGAVDRLRYSWSGVAGDPLVRSINGTPPVTVLNDVRSLTFGSTTRAVAPQDVMTTALVPNPILGASTTPTAVVLATNLSLQSPSRIVPGDLLVAVVATTKDEAANMSAAGWTSLVAISNPGKVSITVWLRTVAVAEPATHTWHWSGAESAIGWIMPLCNHRANTPVAASEFATSVGKSKNPLTPSVNAATANSLLLRVGAFEGNAITNDDVSGLSGHTNLWARNVNQELSAACGYIVPIAAGATGVSTFDLKSSLDYAVATIVITPRTPMGP